MPLFRGLIILATLACLALPVQAAVFCVADDSQMSRALEQSDANGEDDEIRVVSGAGITVRPQKSEPGFSLEISAGWDSDCATRAAAAAPEPAATQLPEAAGPPPAPRQSTTTATPPEAVRLRDESLRRQPPQEYLAPGGASKLLGVPGYLWRHGCGPTAAGMILGWWDLRGYADLFPGGADTQTERVQQGIASQGDEANPLHYQDYSLPIDYYPALYADKSEDPAGDEHPDDCIADFMKTSFSSFENRYGWSWSTHVDPAFVHYAALQNPAYVAATTLHYSDRATFSLLKSEIDAGRPVMLLVDSSGNGSTDHFVPAVGYNDATGEYACWDTWTDLAVRWETFAPMAQGTPWGIWGMWTVSMSGRAQGAFQPSFLQLLLN